MRTIYPVMIVLALGTAATMFGMSGFTDLHDPNPVQDLQSDEEVEKAADDSAAAQDGNFSGQSVSQDDGNIVGLVIEGAGRIASVGALVVLLPFEMNNMGFPWWFAAPVGGLTQAIVGIGIVQFATGRFWR